MDLWVDCCSFVLFGVLLEGFALLDSVVACEG